MGHTLDEAGEVIVEVMITLFAGIGVDVKKPLLGCGEVSLDDYSEIPVQFGDAIAQSGDAVAVEDGYLGGLDGLDIEIGRLFPVEALIIGDPPVLDGKLGDPFNAIVLDEVHPETAFDHEVIGGAGLLLF